MKIRLTRAALVPVRLALGLKPIYGLTIKCRVLQLMRQAGLYKGPINFVVVMPAVLVRGQARV